MNPQSAHVSVSRLSPASLAAVTLAHAGLLGGLLFAPATPEPITPPRPLMVSLLTPTVEAPQPQPKPEPKPQPPKPVTKPLPTPVLAAKPTPVPQPVVETPKPTPLPEPVPELLPPPAPAPVAEAPKPAPPSPPTPTPPRPPDYLNNPKPSYPALSKRLGEKGTVRLNILVNPDGSVAQLELAESSGHPRLDRAAIDTVQSSWKFEPARQGGRPVAAWVIVPIQFTLRS
ncbi:MAG: TonB family protein [Thiobacillus sp.]|uniref:energy transducer TonB n=1 Tax=Thiobacillus sp. TaxID=924 RepID=UPI0027362066|nr:energy transducer TonB [Thiobacillus sp.]MDP3583647.1 TonB family protein [Thiobacillus sp.]